MNIEEYVFRNKFLSAKVYEDKSLESNVVEFYEHGKKIFTEYIANSSESENEAVETAKNFVTKGRRWRTMSIMN